MDLPGSFAPTHGTPVAWFLPLAVAALYLVAVPRRDPSPSSRRVRTSATVGLVVSALLAVGCYVDWGRFRYGSYINEWDVYHYYVGTKYADELGYFGLYEATLVADAESIHRYHNPQHRIRDLRTSEWVDVDTVLARSARIRGRFSADRWREFVGDVRWFATSLPEARFSILLEDKGFNGTPTWMFFVRTLLTSPLSIRSWLGRAAMLAIDPLLFAATFYAIRRAYGLRALLVSIAFVGTHYLFSWGHLKGALVRTDFALCATMAVCAMRLGRPKLAGALLAWAATSRVFPALLVIGPLAVLASTYVRTRTIDTAVRDFVVAFGLAGLAFTSIAFVGLWNPAYFAEWAEKIVHHTLDPSSINIGYATIADADFFHGIPRYIHVQGLLRDDPEARHERTLALAAVTVTVLVPATAFASRLRADRALAFGYVYVFFLMPSAYYYALALLPLLLFFLAEPGSRANRLGTVSLLLGGAAGYLLFSGWKRFAAFPMLRGYHQEFGTYYYMTWIVGFSTLVAVAVAGIAAWRAERTELRAIDPAATPTS